MNIYLGFILGIIIGQYLLHLVVEILNLKCASPVLPEEFADTYAPGQYKKAQAYLKENTRFALIQETIFTPLTILFILLGGFNFVDRFARSLALGPLATGLVFTGILVLALQVLNIPFSLYRTFVMEAKYGFNRTTPRTFVLDILKSWFLIALIGGVTFTAVLWFFSKAGGMAWLYSWMGITGFQLFLTFIAPVVILPLFNKFVPLEEGELKNAIRGYARKERFALGGIFKIDASRRSTKSNAYFTGFGRYRRIALFDTLIKNHSTGELVSILAHEIGHYKRGHIIKRITVSVFSAGLMFFILSLFINNPGLFSVFRMDRVSIYASLVFFGFLFTPINMLFSILANVLSRKHEYEADRFAVTTYHKPGDFILALKKLSVNNLSNLTPHRLKVFLQYSHPPVLERIRALKEQMPL